MYRESKDESILKSKALRVFSYHAHANIFDNKNPTHIRVSSSLPLADDEEPLLIFYKESERRVTVLTTKKIVSRDNLSEEIIGLDSLNADYEIRDAQKLHTDKASAKFIRFSQGDVWVDTEENLFLLLNVLGLVFRRNT